MRTGAMVADFGIARAVSVAGGETLTRTGMAVGTPTYMSPEQAMGSKDVTPESDIYSLACVVYELLAGQPPFTGPTAMALLARHSLDNVPSLKIVRNTIPDAVEDAIRPGDGEGAGGSFPFGDRFRERADGRRGRGASSTRQPEGQGARGRDGGASRVRQWLEEEETDDRRRRHRAAVGNAADGSRGRRRRDTATPEGLTGDYAKSNIAVLYFDDRSPGKQVQHIADGITEALINELSAVQQLKVISGNGVAPFKGNVTAAGQCREGAESRDARDSGIVTPASNGRLKVEVRLVDALTGDQIASTKIEQPEEKLLDLQDSLAHDVSLFLQETRWRRDSAARQQGGHAERRRVECHAARAADHSRGRCAGQGARCPVGIAENGQRRLGPCEGRGDRRELA